MGEKIIAGFVRDRKIEATVELEVETIHYGYPSQVLRWRTYFGQDKDQSPTAWGIDFYEPMDNFPGLYERKEILDHWDGPGEKDEVQALMTFVGVRLRDGKLKKEDIGDFLKRVLRATRMIEE